MKNISRLFRNLLFCFLLFPFAPASGSPKETPPPGMGKYVIVLWPPGTPVPGDPGNKSMRKVEEPDIEKAGGKLLHEIDNRRVVYLPFAAAKALQKHEAVSYIQRIWMGESLDDWDERASSVSAPTIGTNADTDLEWGPKSYSYDGSGNIKQIGTDQYTYDSAGRLIRAVVGGKTESYKYDAYGNLTERGVAGADAVPIAVDPASNRLVGPEYDAAGNVIMGSDRAVYVYDSLNMLSHYSGITNRRILYDASDERIGTIIDSLSRWTIRDFDGQIIREYRGDDLGLTMLWYWELDHVRGEGQLLGGESQEWSYSETGQRFGGQRHYHLDHLGSVRMVTNRDGRSLSEHDYYPFGNNQTRAYQEQINWGDPHIDSMRFAGHWRDFKGHLNVENTDYLDYMHARYYDPNLGRFLSVDPVLGEPSRPQTWNRYSYANNNPVNLIDPKGMYETNCGKDLDCQMNAAYFEGARAQALESQDAAVRAAAAAYGAPGEANGVLVAFGATSNGTPAETAAETAWSMQMVVGPPGSDGTRHIGSGTATPLWGVTVTFDGVGAITPTNVAHEGVHVAHALPFFRSWDGTAFNDSLRVTQYFTESAAYHVTAAFTPRNGTMTVGGQHVFRHGMNREQRQAVVDAILRDRSLMYRISPTNQGGSWPP